MVNLFLSIFSEFMVISILEMPKAIRCSLKRRTKSMKSSCKMESESVKSGKLTTKQ